MRQDLYERGIYLSWNKSARLLNGRYTGKNFSPSLLEQIGAGQERKGIIEELCNKINPDWIDSPCVIDLYLLSSLLKDQPRNDKNFKKFLLLSRLRLQGTDGIRGKISEEYMSFSDAIESFLKTQSISPSLFRLCALSFAELIVETSRPFSKISAVVGEDGRDAFGRGLFKEAIIEGFLDRGIDVYDIEVIPTPGVPIYSAFRKSKIGAVITASHNPSNQNGLKLLYNGFKLLPEGAEGEFALTARMYRIADMQRAAPADSPGPASRTFCERSTGEAETPATLWSVSEEAENLVGDTMTRDLGSGSFSDPELKLVYDGANGAMCDLAESVFTDLGIDYLAVNVDPRGHNINQNGGVAEIEGKEHFDLNTDNTMTAAHLPIIREMKKLAETEKLKHLYGIVNDGDGDRGYILVYSKEEKKVYVLSGDEVAFWVARGKVDELEGKPPGIFVCSVESDIMVAAAAREKLGLNTEIACVGDRWLLLSAREGKNFLVGCEESGHVTYGIEITDINEKKSKVFTGNGLLSCLYALSTILRKDPPLAEIVHPFQGGVKDIRYVYFVDKNRFFPGSSVWQEDSETALSLFYRKLPHGYRAEIRLFEQDTGMLYFSVLSEDEKEEGALFIRNSGTETKTGVAIRCAQHLAPILREIMYAIHAKHQVSLKDPNNINVKLERKTISMLKQGGKKKEEIFAALTKEAVSEEIGPQYHREDVSALLYAMRKEGIVQETETGRYILLDSVKPSS